MSRIGNWGRHLEYRKTLQQTQRGLSKSRLNGRIAEHKNLIPNTGYIKTCPQVDPKIWNTTDNVVINLIHRPHSSLSRCPLRAFNLLYIQERCTLNKGCFITKEKLWIMKKKTDKQWSLSDSLEYWYLTPKFLSGNIMLNKYLLYHVPL